MERKIGEIFEYNGEWYQCVVGNDCENCAFNERKCYTVVDNSDPIGDCCADRRKDNKDVIFKKLEKVGEPMKIHNRLVLKVKADAYNCMMCCFYSKAKCELTIQECERYDCGKGTKFIEINKEDMEEKITLDEMIKKCEKLEFNSYYKQVKDWLIELKQCKEEKHSNSENIGKNLKPFDLQKAREGKPVCTRDGRKARIICFDRNDLYPIVALIECEDGKEIIGAYSKEGQTEIYEIKGTNLMMLPEKKEGWVNVYTGGLLDTKSYPTKKEAFAKASLSDYVDTVKICWKE